MSRLVPAALVSGALVASTLAAGAADAAPAARPGRAAVQFHTTKHGTVVAPTTTRPGIAHLKTADYRTFVAVVEAKHGTGSARQVAAGLNAPGPHRLLSHYRFVALVTPGQGDYTRLTRGTYYVANMLYGKFKASRTTQMTVTGSTLNARLPKSESLVIDRRTSVHAPRGLSHRDWVHVLNLSSAFTSVLVIGVATKETYATLQDLVQHPTVEKVFSVLGPNSGLSFGEVDGHSSTWVPFHGRAGRYVAAVIPWRGGSDGNPRLHPGQVRIVHVR